MPRVFEIPEDRLPAFAVLRDLGPDGIERLTKAIQSKKVLLHIDELQQAIEPILGADTHIVSDVLVGLSLSQRKGRSPERLVDDLTNTLQVRSEELDPPWSEADFERWVALREPLKALLSAEPIRTVGKALDLHFAHANILSDVTVVTDVRPVFDSPGETPLAVVISHTLCLRYFDDGRAERISIALDHGDLTQLIKVCERAVKKERSLKTMFGGILRTEIAGDDTDGEV